MPTDAACRWSQLQDHRRAGWLARLTLALGGAATARVLLAGGDRLPRPVRAALVRRNHRGRAVSLAAGPALALAAATSAYAGAGHRRFARAALLAALAGGAAGLYDDLAGARPQERADKGVAGHLRALRQRRISAGTVKALALGAAGIAAGIVAAPAAERNPVDVGVTGGVVAGSANLVNLLDLRPGRALKATLLLGAPLLAGSSGRLVAGPLGAAAALLPADLAERTMLGDTGANALGAVLGLAWARAVGRRGRLVLLVVLAALMLASEWVSFTAVIERAPGLRALDGWGRRPTET